MKSVLKLPHVLHFVWHHPLSRQRRLARLRRFVAWQIGARLVPGPVATPFVNQTRLLVRPGMAGATGNVYTGLHEYHEMAFVLHALREQDLFVDVGANVGAYTLLAAGGIGCRCIAIEPARKACAEMLDNLRLNGLESFVELHLLALGDAIGEARITDGLDTMNRVVLDAHSASDQATSSVPMTTLDTLIGDRSPTIIKIDVEGFEQQVLAGGRAALQRPSMLAVIVETERKGNVCANQFAQLAATMKSLGYSACDYDGARRRLSPITSGARGGANTVFVRSIEQLMNRISTAPRFRLIDAEV